LAGIRERVWKLPIRILDEAEYMYADGREEDLKGHFGILGINPT
jgi:hypothetical protein